MSFTACIQPFDRYLRMVMTGSMKSADELMDYHHLIVRLCGEYGLNRVLLDERGLQPEADLLDAYVFADSDLAQHMVECGFRLACLPKPENRKLLQGVETLLSNRSLSFRVFDSEAEGVAWLIR